MKTYEIKYYEHGCETTKRISVNNENDPVEELKELLRVEHLRIIDVIEDPENVYSNVRHIIGYSRFANNK